MKKFVFVILLSGCLPTTNHNPMKKDTVASIATVTTTVVAPITSPTQFEKSLSEQWLEEWEKWDEFLEELEPDPELPPGVDEPI